jgi:RimJ/RimL family protein N-acetyltransferase
MRARLESAPRDGRLGRDSSGRNRVELRDISMSDLALYEALLTDPAMMSELGGPLARDWLEQKLRGIVDDVRAGRTWYFTIIPDGPGGSPAGTVCVWDSDLNGEAITEIGWMVLSEFQGRGLASEAVRLTLDRARSEGRWHAIHAFPGITNAPSNSICRKLGFSKEEELDIDYAGRTLRCNHWVLSLRAEGPL